MSKGTNTNRPAQPPNLAGTNPQSMNSQQATLPSTYFAGARKLKLLWLMQPVDQFTLPTPSGGGKKGSGGSSKKGGGAGQSLDYYGSIAGIACCGALDFIWGITKDDGVVWPSAEPWQAQTGSANWPIGSFVVDGGKIWTNSSTETSNEPPAGSWTIFKQDLIGPSIPYHVSIDGIGDGYIYRGTSTQTLDPSADVFLTNYNHPPYRYRAFIAFKGILFGTENQTAPNLCLLAARTPAQTLITGSSASLDGDWQANPWTVIAELLTHPVYGLGIPNSKLDATSFQAEADWCYARAARTYISPLYDQVQKVRTIISDLLAYVDGWAAWYPDGTLHVGHWPHGENAPGGMTNLSWHDLAQGSDPNSDSDTWNGTSSGVSVEFQDAVLAFGGNSMPCPNLWNRQVTRRVQMATISRPFITRASQAAAVASEWAKIMGLPYAKVPMKVRAEKAASILPGSLFTFTDDQIGQTLIYRCKGKTIAAPPAGLVTLDCETERGVGYVPYQATPDGASEASRPTPARVQYFEFFAIPPELAGGADFNLALLAARSDALTSRIDVWWRQADGSSFEKLATETSFAASATLHATSNTTDVSNESVTSSATLGHVYTLAHSDFWNLTLQYQTGSGPWNTATAGTDYGQDSLAGTVTPLSGGAISAGDHIRVSYSIYLQVTFASGTTANDIEALSTPLTADEINNGTILVFVSQAGAPNLYEIFSLKAVSALGGGVYQLTVRRTQFATKYGGDGSYVFTTSDPAFIIARDSIVPFTHDTFETLWNEAATATFRLVPSTAWVEADVADVYNATTNPNGLTTETTFTFGDPFAPHAAWTALLENSSGSFAAITTFASAFPTGTSFRFSVAGTDANGDLVGMLIQQSLGGAITVLANDHPAPTGSFTRTIQFQLSVVGSYTFFAIVTDATGRVSSEPLTLVGGTTPQTLLIQDASPTKVLAPVINPTAVINSTHTQFTIADGTSGATIYYQIVAAGASPDLTPGGPWTTYSAAFIAASTHTIYSYATHSGLTNSDVSSWYVEANSNL